MSERAQQSSGDQAALRLEPPDVSTALVLMLAGGLAAFVALTIGGVWLFYSGHVVREPAPLPATFSAPRLQTSNGSDDLARLRAREQSRLAGYAWVDRDKGVIRIPIERAMGQVVTRGSGGYGPAEPAETPSPKAPSP